MFLVAVIAAYCACIDSDTQSPSPSPSPQASFVRNSSTIDRYRVDSNLVEMYTPGVHEVGLFDPATGQIQTAPADPETANRLFSSAGSIDGNDLIDEGDHSCSSRDGKQDCFCDGSCCRDQTTCWCTGC